MSTISVTNINDGDAVTAASVNNQINTIVNDYNGNITAANLASSAVTDAKITANNLLATKFSNPYKFRVYRNSALTLATGAQIVTFDTRTYDTSSNVDITTNKGRFTAPVAGFYFFTSTVSLTQGTPYTYNLILFKNGVNISQGQGNVSANSNGGQYIVTDTVQLAANDYVEVYASTSNPGGQALGVGSTTSYFSGFLVSSI